ncbi:uncharacterized protein PpBr36_06407 [Pyricularia pennisetigena]|uniref:uncharacterized protein n=1 Tax=Pyricularia pennisetigena TaxID=1578925 RepID=UPI0011524B13|nr:uncharacterized protein PpBr36_06407 [Pyricularia pennisetigena]TLS23761.1 hypothetical protein PpBr36_06407 [Pyricularia pennisetigena]
MDEAALQIRASLISQSLPPPSQTWLSNLLSTRPKPLPPLPSLTATAKARLLAADLTSPGLLDRAGTSPFPPSAADPETRETCLTRDVVVQVLDVENLSRSRWEQVEELEAVARGELTKGRQIIRLREDGAEEDGEGVGDVPPEEGARRQQQQQQQQQQAGGGAAARATAGGPAVSDKNATHKLVVQDCAGNKFFALEVRRVERLGIGKTNIGEKMLIRAGTVVARGTVLLEPEKCVVLGGRVEAWHKAWLDGRLARLKEAAGASATEHGH